MRLEAQVSVPLTVQEALYTGAPTTGINRTQDPVTVGIPLPDSVGISSISQLGLSGAAVGQFRILGRWPSGNIKWVLVDTQADLTAGGQNTSISVTSGTGNFGGSDLATDNGSNITVNTGTAQFTIRKANFNLFDQVVVNGKVVVAPGTSPGLVLMGPSSGTSCGVCTDPYSSSNDPASTAIIEENGPARAVVKVDGSHVDAAGQVYMHYTVRMHFYRGKTHSKVEVILRNADETDNTAGDFNSAFKGFASYEARVTAALGASKSFNIGTDSSTASGTFTGSDSAYLYQAYSNNMEMQDWNASNCTASGDNRCVASYISRTSAAGGGYVYSQDGYEIVHGGNVLASGDHTKYPQGWADLSDTTGAGIEIGVYQLSSYWPKSLQFVNGGSEVRIGIWPDQSLSTKGGGQAYYQAWPTYSIQDLYFEFHNAAPASPANDFLAFQHYLLARAPRTEYNNAGVFFYPLIDPTAEDNYYKSISVGCCLEDKAPKIFRHYDWPAAGAGNQHELRWSYLRNFLQRGLTGRYLFAAHFYRMVAEQSFPRSDGFDWRNHPITQLNYLGFPAFIASANGSLANRGWIEGEHAHWYGMTDYYFLTGDETIKDQLMDGIKDGLLNANAVVNNGKMGEARDIGERLMGIARLYQFLNAINDSDASGLLPISDNILNLQVFPELNVSSYGTGNPVPGGSQGVSRTRGVQYGCCNSDAIGGLSGRPAAPFREAILSEGMWELAQARGPGWSNYHLTTDLSYAISQWALREGYGAPPGQIPTPMNSGFIYETFLDQANGTSKYLLTPGEGQTNWYHFFVPAAYSGDTSWQQKFEWYAQRLTTNLSLNILAEYGSHMMQAVVDKILNPPTLQLVTVPIAVHNNGGGSYTLSWTVPQSTVSYRIKSFAGKTIVEWIGFNPATNAFIGDPATTAPWFAATEVANPPLPAAAGSLQTFTVTSLDQTQNFNFAVKAYVGRAAGTGGDTTPPIVSLTAPNAGATISGIITASANATDNVGVASVVFQADGKQIGSTLAAPPYAVSLNTAQLSDGQHVVAAVATDLAGNLGQASVTVTVNNSTSTTPPTVAITSPAGSATISGTVTVTANATDKVGVASVVFQADGKQIGSTLSAPPYAVSLNTVQLSDGQHVVAAVATDLAGNRGQASVTVTVNNSTSTTPPTVAITSPTAGATISGTIAVTANVTDKVGVRNVVFQAGGKQIGSPVTTPPYAVSLNTTQLSNASQKVTAVATDMAGNSSQTSVTVMVKNTGSGDTTPPRVAIISPISRTMVSGTISVTVSASDEVAVGSVVFEVDRRPIGSPVTSPPYAVALNTTQLSNGSHTLTVVATDLAGNSAQASATVMVNNSATPPASGVLSIISPQAGSTISGKTLISVTTTEAVAGVQIKIDSANFSHMLNPSRTCSVSWAERDHLLFQCSLDTTQLSNGLHTLNAVATDLVGKSVQASITVIVSNTGGGAAAPPTLEITAPASGAKVSGTITLAANAGASVGVASVVFQVDGHPISSPSMAPPYWVSLNTAQFSNRAHTVTAVATDMAGNSAQDSVTVTVKNTGPGDTTPPTVAIATPISGAPISGTITVTANASDNVGVASVAFQLDGRPIGSPVTAAPYAASLNTTQFSNGSHTLTAVATDLVGNSAQASVTVTANNSAAGPTVVFSPSSLSFGGRVRSTTGAPRTVTLTNGGSVALNVTSISASGDFAQTNTCGKTVTTQTSCTISVTFTPTAMGTRTGTLTIDDSASNSPQTFSLTGSGTSITNSSCAPGQWCGVLPNGSVSGPPDEGWDLLVFSHDTGKFYLYANSGLAPSVNPWENAFWSYMVQGQPASGNPWEKLSDCGDSTLTINRQHRLSLAVAVGASDSQLTLNMGGGSLDSPNFPQSGTIWLDDEAMNYTSCTSQGGNGTCQPGASTLTLGNLVRGVRQAAGYTAAVPHLGGAPGNLACPNPTLNGSASTDHPSSRHPVGGTTYDSTRGRIWEAWGYQETWQLQDSWYLCIFQTASCSASQISAGWQRLPLFTTGGANPSQYQENAMVYDPDHDVIVEFGGTKSGATSDAHVFCLTAGAAYGCSDPTNLNKWVKVTPHDGTPVPDDAERMVYDTVHHRVLTYGGTSPSAGTLHLVQQYDPATGDWCLSDTTQGGSNAASCTLPPVSGSTPPGMRFAPWTFDNMRGKAALYAGPNALYTYDAAQNQWTLTSVAGGPALPGETNGTSWAYDDIHDTYVLVTAGALGFQTWELPGSAIAH